MAFTREEEERIRRDLASYQHLVIEPTTLEPTILEATVLEEPTILEPTILEPPIVHNSRTAYTYPNFAESGRITSKRSVTTFSALVSLISLPTQALVFFLVSRFVQQLVLSIDSVYEATSRRARSPFVALPWLRLTVGLVLLGAYHVGLMRLTVRSWQGLRKRERCES